MVYKLIAVLHHSLLTGKLLTIYLQANIPDPLLNLDRIPDGAFSVMVVVSFVLYSISRLLKMGLDSYERKKEIDKKYKE